MLELFVTGADKNSDKIFITAGLTATMQSLGYSSAVYKPVETGVIEKNGFVQSHDLAFVKFIDPYIKTYYSYLLKDYSTPLIAAAKEGLTIDKDKILADFQKIQDMNECLIVDGISGLTVPLNKDFLEEDMVKILNLPLLLVISALKTPIDNTLLIINHAKERNITFRGVIITDFPENSCDANIKLMPRLIEEYTDVKILGILSQFDRNINPNDLITEVLNGVDIEAVFNIKIAKLQL